MRRFLLLVFLLPLALGAQRLPYGARVSPTASVRIWLPAGSVRIEAWDHDSIEATGAIGKGSQFFAGASTTSAKLGAERDNPLDGIFAHADLVVRVPRGAQVWVKMTDGQVTCQGIHGEFEVTTVTGTIDIRNSEGVVSVNTIDAAVSITGARGAVRVDGGSGLVRLSGLSGTLTATTVGGGVDLDAGALEDARIKTISGPVTLRGPVAPKAMLELETHDGPIALLLPRGAVPDLALSSRGGKVKNPLTVQASSPARIVARSFKGDINVVPGAGIEGRKSTTPP